MDKGVIDLSKSLPTKLVLFPNSSRILAHDAQGSHRAVEALQGSFLALFKKRFDALDAASMSLIDIANVLVFTADEKTMIDDVVRLLGADEGTQRWVGAEVDCANHFIKTLIGGQVSHYPDVDGPSFPNEAGQYLAYLRECLSILLNGDPKAAMTDRFSIVADVQYRNDGGRLVENLAMQHRENEAALVWAQNLDVTQHPYGAVVILGHSPTEQEAQEGLRELSQISIDKVERSVAMNPNFTLAPLFILCGGTVRPKMTRINEARSMKQYLMKHHNIPEERILLDATSEHTYSNFMNAVLIANRLLLMPIGTKLAVFMDDGKSDQYEFTMAKTGLFKSADREIFPSIRVYFSIQDGPEPRSIDLTLISDTRDFMAETLMWKDYGYWVSSESSAAIFNPVPRKSNGFSFLRRWTDGWVKLFG
ncbi:hypothetical protein C8F01DRAFT_1247145 [Mycena amicta]|nr:hypothetical protein C8F01DRAFT_1247145 [Mycena amicta]